MGNAREITDAEFDSVVLKSSIPVMVDYWATWCAPCKQVAPIIEEIATEFAGRALVVKMDADANPVTPAKYNVMGLPTIQVIVDGEVVKSFQGGKTKGALVKALEEYL